VVRPTLLLIPHLNPGRRKKGEMSIRVRHWAESHPLRFGAAVIIFAIAIFGGGLVWMNSAEGAISVQPTQAAVTGTCTHKTYVRWEYLNGPTQEMVHTDYLTWRTSGSIDGCEGTSVTIISSSYSCSWQSGYGYTGSCSAWYSTAGHGEVNGVDNALGVHFTVKAQQNVTKNGGQSYSCAITSGSLPSGIYGRCTHGWLY
jgi:hypothetical protein